MLERYERVVDLGVFGIANLINLLLVVIFLTRARTGTRDLVQTRQIQDGSAHSLAYVTQRLWVLTVHASSVHRRAVGARNDAVG